MSNLIGLHDRESVAIAMPDTWVVDTIALSENPQPPQYDSRLHYIARANWGYGSTGTLPTPDGYGEYVSRLTNYVRLASGCHRWIIGNETNLPREWPNGQPIYPNQYAQCYMMAATAIRALSGHENDEVLVAGPGPWNPSLKYAGNSSGDWVQCFADTIAACGDMYGGAALHAYTHGYNTSLVTSEATMAPPFANRRYEFRTYRDFLNVVPAKHRNKPVHITEANGDGPWQAVGLMPAMADEINAWNQSGTPKIQSLVFYRYPKFDEYYIDGKSDVIAEYRAVTARGYQSPTVTTASTQQEVTRLPQVANQQPASALPPIEWDPRLTARGVSIMLPQQQLQPGQKYWRVVKAQWFSEAEAGGRHHIYVEAPNGTPFRVAWPSGSDVKQANGRGGFDAGNMQMSPSLREFSVKVEDGTPSETVTGIGMGADGNPGIHTSTLVRFELVTVPAAQQPTPQPTQPSGVPALTHPVQDPQYRRVTQVFGVRPEYYSQYKIDGVPLKGHEGVDFGTPVGSMIVAVDGGTVTEVGDQGSIGYGKWVKIVHAWGETVYAHLSKQLVQVGQQVSKGQPIGLSGNTGNSDGPHLHFGMRVTPFNRADGWGGYVDPMPYLQAQATPTTPVQPTGDVLSVIKAAASEFGIDWRLLASQAWAESSWNPNAVSSAGAKGLLQIMDATWAEQSPLINAGNDPFDARQNARLGAAYLKRMIQVANGNIHRALIAYGWGPGNLLSGQPVPTQWQEYANKIVFGRDLLKAV